jgi:hypothetical protein
MAAAATETPDAGAGGEAAPAAASGP